MINSIVFNSIFKTTKINWFIFFPNQQRGKKREEGSGYLMNVITA